MAYKPLQRWYKRERKMNENGYVLVKVPEHPKSFCGGWYYEHRLCAEKDFGRVLFSYETVHHINECKTDNFPENLFVCTRKEHDYANLPLNAA